MRLVILSALLVVCALTVPSLRAQTRVDTLQNRLEGATGPERLPLLVDLVEALCFDDPAQAIVYGREAQALLNDETADDLVRRTWYWKGRAYAGQGEIDSLMVDGQRLRAWAEATGDALGEAQGAYLMGYGFLYQGVVFGKEGSLEQANRLLEDALSGFEALEADEVTLVLGLLARLRRAQDDNEAALAVYARMLPYYEQRGDKESMAIVMNNMGIVYKEQGDYDKALDVLMQSLSIREELGNKNKTTPILNNIGLIYREQGDYEDALDFFERAEAIHEARGGKGEVVFLNNIAITHRMQGNYDKALDVFARALSLAEDRGIPGRIGGVLNEIGITYREQGRLDEALDVFERVLAIRKEIDYNLGIVQTLIDIGALYVAQGQINNALTATDEALALAESIDSLPSVRDAQEQRARILELQERFAEALAAHKAFKAAQDSLFSSESQGVIAELQQKYRTREQQQRIKSLEREAQIETYVRIGLIGGVLLIAIIAALLYNRYRIKTQAHTRLQRTHTKLVETQQQLIQQEKMASLGQLTAGIAHEIKNPLNFVNNFAELNAELAEEAIEAIEDGEAPEEVKAILLDLKQNAQVINQHGKRADGIVHAMMQHASGGTGKREMTDLNQLVSEHLALAYHGKRAQVPGLQVEITQELSREAVSVEVVPQEIGRVFLNLFGNALDAVYEYALNVKEQYSPTVKVSTRRANGQVEIRVSDNGPGIRSENREKIFEPFFTTKPTGTGTGLGLSLSYDIITQGHGGTLTLAREGGRGATFIITLPMSQRVRDRDA